MDRDIRDAERLAAAGDVEAEDRLEYLQFRAEGSPAWRAWVQQLSEASRKIPQDIDAVFEFWNILNDARRRGVSYVKVPLPRDFNELFSQILKADWLESEILKIYKYVIKGEWWGRGTGIYDYDFTLIRERENIIIRLNLGVDSDEEEDDVERLLDEIDQHLSHTEYDLAMITNEASVDNYWDSSSKIEVYEEDEDGKKISGQFDSTHQIEAYHIFHVLAEHNKYATEKIVEQYIELFSQKD